LPRSRSAPIEADYRRMIGFGVESIPKKNRGKEGGLAPARGRLHIEAIQLRNVHLPRFINSFSFCSRAISCNLPRCAAIQRGKHTFQTCNLLHCTVDGEIAVARNQSRASADQRGQAGDLEMVQAQGGAKPLGKGLVNHPVFSSKWVMRAME
jgi:hypothetical protein